jgi:DNA ligase-associated metallophosphoesterase
MSAEVSTRGRPGSPSGAVTIDCRGEQLQLLPERALWWPAASVLLVADVHIGKAATFRALGQPVPAGTTAVNLQRLEELVQRLGASRLVVLGDFLHARQARQPSIVAALADWRRRLPRLACTLVEGNHDRRAGLLPPDLAIERVPDPLMLGPFELSHGDRRPRSAGPGAFRLEGHLHPAYVLRGRAGERLRLPCFVFGESAAILPAFGEFTGNADVLPKPGERVYVVGDGRVWPVPAPPT